MWLLFAFLSALLLGCYDVFKKRSLINNAVIPVLLLNTFICALIFAPSIVGSQLGVIKPCDLLYIPMGRLSDYLYVTVKALIVLSSWICGYYSIKHLPLTIVGPINATRPVLVLVGAMLIYGERLNLWQWVGVLLAIISFYLLSRSSKQEGIKFQENKWVGLLLLAALLGASSGLYDKFLLQPVDQGGLGLQALFVQGWYNIFQFVIMLLIAYLIWWKKRHYTTKFVWRWEIVCISLFLTLADMAYFYALNDSDAMISVVSMVRRGSVIISFAFGYFLFKEKNVKSKLFDLLLVLLSMICLYLGTI
jgi:drug/metabolite transporter (DMT)-like permease